MRKEGEPKNEPGPVMTRQATPEELAELEVRLRKKYGEKKAVSMDEVKKRLRMSGILKEKRNAPTLGGDDVQRLKSCCSRISKEQWEIMRAFVIVAGAVRGWSDGAE